ncbi:TPA: DMT family transporter [archaeon]|uniref:DMT family transporter n=1 Tax=Candidatus Naiadarchaeum limnaeum TaxID=2756139 RepID=A0A832XLU2_9ARCH|nr:DMT family transporter [Candidatus Naiadarchaeum limnaeum]
MVESWVLFASASLLLFGIMNFVLKFVSDKAPVPLLTFVIYLSTIILPLGYFVFSGTKFQITNNVLALTVLIGIIGSAAFISMTYALRAGTASQVIPVINLNTLVTVALAVLIINEKLTPKIGLGVVFAVVSLYLLTS